MPPDGTNEACPTSGEETPMLKKDVGAADLSDARSSSGGKNTQRRYRLPAKHAVKLLVFLDMFAVALVVPLLSSYFRDLNIR